MKIAFKTLGCRLNQYETDSVLTDFVHAGYEVVPFSEIADVYVINTCTVTRQGDHKSQYAINQAVSRNAEAVIVVTGCMAESRRSYLDNRNDIHYVVDNKSKASILSLVEAHFNGETLPREAWKKDIFGFSLAEKGIHTRGMVKIQDGCDNFCSYCIVPSVRGAAVSRPALEVIDNVKQLLEHGFKEIVLTGVNISRYECGKIGFTDLLEEILDIEGDFRIRISSVEPEGLNERFFDLFSDPRLCPHLHLCLQSGSDRILQFMHRTYKLADYSRIIASLRYRYPLFNFTTDILVGFPGETEDDFEQTCRAVQNLGFSHVHTFKYSLRQGTRAVSMPDHITENEKDRRSARVREIAARGKLQYRQNLVGSEQMVLIEKISRSGIARGYGQHYVPVEFESKQKLTNRFEKVLIKNLTGAARDYLLRG
jgi:threonylcarbamoyladenosine tRNA methylthiotransferase MtaB